MLARIVGPYFVAGVDLTRKRAAPLVAYMAHWSPVQIARYCHRKGWQVTFIP
jgi:hypothetical protein